MQFHLRPAQEIQEMHSAIMLHTSKHSKLFTIYGLGARSACISLASILAATQCREVMS